MQTTAIVTGGTKGIGFGIAHAVLSGGGRVMITGRDTSGVAEAVGRLTAGLDDPSRVAGLASDVRDRQSVEAVVRETVERFGGFNVLVNNAGVGMFADVREMTDDDWSRVIDTNLTGVFYCCRAALPHLKRAGSSWIINIASLAGRNFLPKGAAYCASKAGLVAFSESLMLDVRADGVRVSVIMPGSVDTDFGAPSAPGADNSWKLAPDDIGEVVMDLLRQPSRSLPSKIEIRPAR